MGYKGITQGITRVINDNCCYWIGIAKATNLMADNHMALLPVTWPVNSLVTTEVTTVTGCAARELAVAVFGFVSQWQYLVTMEPVTSITGCTGVLAVQ